MILLFSDCFLIQHCPLTARSSVYSLFRILLHFKSLGWDSCTGTPRCSLRFVDGITEVVVTSSLRNISFKGVSEFHPWVLANLKTHPKRSGNIVVTSTWAASSSLQTKRNVLSKSNDHPAYKSSPRSPGVLGPKHFFLLNSYIFGTTHFF